MVAVDELPQVYISDSKGIGQEWMWTHERTPGNKVNVGAMRTDRTVQNEEFLVPNHLFVEHIPEGVPSNEESHQVSNVLGEEIEDYSVNDTPSRAPHFGKCVGNCD